MLLRIFNFQNVGRPPSGILIFSQFLSKKNQICAYIFIVMQNLVKIGRCAAELLRIFYFQKAAVCRLGFSYFRNFCKKKSKFAPVVYICRQAKFGEDRTIRGRVIAYLRFSKWRPSAILDFHIFAISWKIQIFTYIYVDKQNLMKIGLSAAELLRIFDFQTGRRPPSSIFIFPQFLWKIQISPIY